MSQPGKLSIPCLENAQPGASPRGRFRRMFNFSRSSRLKTASLPAHIANRPLEQYQYQKLGSENELRLLHVRQSTDSCSFEIVHRNLLRSLEYEAVSYVWGNPERTHTLLLSDNTRFPLTSSVSTALPYLAARSTTRYLWIDQICINQADVDERNTEVPKMGAIYKSATRVIAWLEVDNSETRLVQEIIKTAGEMPQKAKTPYYRRLDPEVAENVSSLFPVQQGQNSYLHALSHFLSNPWFRRVWCFQEALLCRHLSFLVGAFELGNALEGLFMAVAVLHFRSDKAEEYDQVCLSNAIPPLQSMFTERRRTHFRGRHTPFHVLLSDMGAYGEASDPRDIVYGFLVFNQTQM